jgi:heterotetrameric sarcosine oxidase gamma subunit
MCTRTLFEKAEITLWRRGAQAWQIEIARSFAPYLREMAAAIVAAGVLLDFVIDDGGLR